MATGTPHKRPVRLIFLIYGVFALLISLALAAFAFRGNLFPASAEPTATSSPIVFATPTPALPTVTVGPGTPTATIPVAAPPPATPASTSTPTTGIGSAVDNPLG